MPVEAGTITISAPTAGDEVITGLLRVSGMATSGEFQKADGTFVATLPPSTVIVRVDGGTSQVATQRAADWQRWDVLLNVPAPGPHTITATASRDLGVWTAVDQVGISAVAPRMQIDGVEQTQGIQFFDYEFQGSAAGPDNSVPLIAQKATILRVYVSDILNPPGSVHVSGQLTIGPTTLVPSNGPIALRDENDIDRGQADHTLNFFLSPSLCVGTLNCKIRVFDPDRPGPRLYEDEMTFSVTFSPTPRLRIHGVLVHSTRPGFNFAAPTSTAFTVSLDTTARSGPTHQINYTGFTVIDFAGDLTAPATAQSGVCGPGWDDLLARLITMRTLSGTTDLYIALLPTGAPLANVKGCGGGGVGAAREGEVFTLMHEVGHALGRLHAPCPPTVVSPDPSYPSFTNPHTNRPAYPAGTIGEYGFNLATNSVLSPQGTRDIMSSGCSPVWISPYTFVGVRNAIVATQPFSLAASSEDLDAAASIEADLVGASDPAEHLHLIVRVHEEGHAEFVSAFHVVGPIVAEEQGPLSSITCELLAADGRVIESARLYGALLQREQATVSQYFGAVPWDSSAHALALTRNGERIYERPLERSAPRVRLGSPEIQDERGHVVRFEWTTEAVDDAAVAYVPRYSHDDGESWRAVGPVQSETSYVLDLRTLPGGQRCRFQVLASSGVRTSATETDPFTVEVKPTVVEILSPGDSTELRAGEAVLLHGRAFSPDFATTPAEGMLWFSDRDGLLGTGPEARVTLSTGAHELTLRVADGLGGEAEDVVNVQVH